MIKYFISLGSNIGEREKNLQEALGRLEKEGVKIIQKSSIYETSPVGVTDQPWFLNQVALVETGRKPKEFLLQIKKIESDMGRILTMSKGPRCIDIDILLAGKRIFRSKELIIPHPEMAKRNFILIPLDEIAGEIVHPVLNETVEDLRLKSEDPSIVRLFLRRD